MTNINQAASAYQAALNQIKSSGAEASPEASGGPSFGDILKSGAQSAINAQHASEKTSVAAIVGKADMTEVLQAVTDAEMALNTVLAVRDRVVQAYEQVMRTPI